MTVSTTSVIGGETHWSVGVDVVDDRAPSAAFTEEWLPLTTPITLCIGPRLREAAWLDALLQDLRRVVTMTADWNGSGERSIHPASAKRAVEILNRLSPTIPRPYIVPLSSGALQLEWHGPDCSVEVEVPPEGRVIGNAYSEDDDLDIEWLVAGQSTSGCGVADLDRLLADLAA